MARFPVAPRTTRPSIVKDTFFDGVKLWLKESSLVDDELQPALQNLKVIDCATRTLVYAPADCVYLALSYVWGTNQDCSSLDGNLPQSIEDSLRTVLLLGHRYLWVDRYCIDQTVEDKHYQIQQMGAIYAGAHMTIIAFSGDDPTCGLPGVSRKIDRTILWTSNMIVDILDTSAWAKRAWTFQEDYLSKRKLFFTDAGLIYTCKGSPKADIMSQDQRRLIIALLFITVNGPRSLRLTDVEGALWDAENIMERYSNRQLTFESDALNAIVGVLNALSTRRPSVGHIWGVPFVTANVENEQTVALFWSSMKAGTRRPAFPSWSSLGWTSIIKGPYSTTLRHVRSGDFGLEVYRNGEFRHISQIAQNLKDAHCLTQESQCLKITSYSIQLEVNPCTDPNTRKSSHRITLPVNDKLTCHIKPCWDDEKCIQNPPNSVLCVFQSASSASGLILKLHGTCYERIGSFEGDRRFDPSRFHHSTKELFDKPSPSDSGAATTHKVRPIKRRTIMLR